MEAEIGDIVIVHFEDIAMHQDISDADIKSCDVIGFKIYGKMVALTSGVVKVLLSEDLNEEKVKEHILYAVPMGCVISIKKLVEA